MHREVLTKEASTLFGYLRRFPSFYLAGGTALALQIGHRVSVDFDLFCADTIDRLLLDRVRRVFDEPSSISPLVNNGDELTVLIGGVKIIFLRYPFPPLEPLVMEDGLQVLSPRDIAATKAYTIGRRGAYKDYVDLYFIISGKHATLDEIITLADEKHGPEFNSRLFLEQLVFLDDVEDVAIQFLGRSISRPELLRFFEDHIRQLRL